LFLKHADTVQAALQGKFINGLDRLPPENFNIADSSVEEATWHT
jgi:hypothetical protein